MKKIYLLLLLSWSFNAVNSNFIKTNFSKNKVIVGTALVVGVSGLMYFGEEIYNFFSNENTSVDSDNLKPYKLKVKDVDQAKPFEKKPLNLQENLESKKFGLEIKEQQYFPKNDLNSINSYIEKLITKKRDELEISILKIDMNNIKESDYKKFVSVLVSSHDSNTMIKAKLESIDLVKKKSGDDFIDSILIDQVVEKVLSIIVNPVHKIIKQFNCVKKDTPDAVLINSFDTLLKFAEDISQSAFLSTKDRFQAAELRLKELFDELEIAIYYIDCAFKPLLNPSKNSDDELNNDGKMELQNTFNVTVSDVIKINTSHAYLSSCLRFIKTASNDLITNASEVNEKIEMIKDVVWILDEVTPDEVASDEVTPEIQSFLRTLGDIKSARLAQEVAYQVFFKLEGWKS